MALIVKNEAKDYPKASEGQHAALCIDLVGPWNAVDDFDKSKPYPIQKVAFIFQLDETREDGKPMEVAKEVSLSFGKKANLRKFLGSWRGKEITDAEAATGLDIEAFKGRAAFLTIQHKASRTGKVRAEVTNIIPLPKPIPAPNPQPYTRAPWWAKREKEDGERHQAVLAEQVKEGQNYADFPAPLAEAGRDEDDLPF